VELLQGIVLAFMSAVGFSVLFNIPRRSILSAGFCGAVGWGMYLLIFSSSQSAVLASFCGALAVGLSGEFFAKICKKPATIYVVPGIIVLVPGYGFYQAMHLLTGGKHMEAAKVGSQAFFIAIAIACGILITVSIMKIFTPGPAMQDAE